jgi:SNF2 family DNA or RNA helicase
MLMQNNLMELWSLLHFLMPHVFRSRKEFSYWFSNPFNSMIEGNTSRNDELIGRLHGIIRPFVLRRLKKEVEKQMPGKYEHIVKTQLSRRQVGEWCTGLARCWCSCFAFMISLNVSVALLYVTFYL